MGLKHTSEIRVRFNEVDAMGIVWHGHYISYFEQGREAFGRAYGISYLDVKKKGYSIPIVESKVQHKLPLTYGDIAKIETSFEDTASAKMIFNYKIFNPKGEIVCTGKTVQVFLYKNKNLSLNLPAFFHQWKEKVRLI